MADSFNFQPKTKHCVIDWIPKQRDRFMMFVRVCLDFRSMISYPIYVSDMVQSTSAVHFASDPGIERHLRGRASYCTPLESSSCNGAVILKAGQHQ